MHQRKGTVSIIPFNDTSLTLTALVCRCVTVTKQDRSVYCEDWGETLTNKSVPVVCVVNLQCGSVSVLQGVPLDVSPGQVRAGSPPTALVLYVLGSFIMLRVFCGSSSRLCGLAAVSLCFWSVGTTNLSDSDCGSAPTAGQIDSLSLTTAT